MNLELKNCQQNISKPNPALYEKKKIIKEQNQVW